MLTYAAHAPAAEEFSLGRLLTKLLTKRVKLNYSLNHSLGGRDAAQSACRMLTYADVTKLVTRRAGRGAKRMRLVMYAAVC